MNWKKLLKRFAVITGATILVLVATSIIILKYYEDEVIDYAIQRINENLRVKANVGEAHLVLWKTFPNASVELSNIMVEDSYGRHDTLFTADEIYLSFDLIQLFRGDYTIKKIAADDVDASLKRNKKGVPNWDVWKKTDSADSTKFELALEKIELNDAVVVYEDEKNQLFLDLLSTSTTAAGNFSADDIALQIEYEGEVTQLIRGESHFVSSLPMTLAAGIQIHTAQSSLEIQSCELNSDNLKLTATGTFDFSETPSYELAVSGKELDVAALLKHLPESVVHTLEAYRPGGTVGLTLNVSDRNKQKSTVTRADFTVENASLSRQATGVGINGVEAQ
ncbi:MAG: AsmA family protein, partial [Flavobacteriales bacterium]|nr:AsmA family protein [Flavobacteriales bacterium]